MTPGCSGPPRAIALLFSSTPKVQTLVMRSLSIPAECLEIKRSRVVIGVFLLYSTLIMSKTVLDRRKHVYQSTGQFTLGKTQDIDSPVQSLLVSLRIATVAGSVDTTTGTEVKFTPTDRLEWEARNPCKSREELKLRYQRRKSTKSIDTPPALTVLMREYAKLHRTCIRASGNLTKLFLSEKASTACQFLIAEAGNGIGNRILWMVSTLMYAVLARRVILIDPRSMIPSLMCEPFSGSSWVAPLDFPFADLRSHLWKSTDEFIAALDAAKMNGTEVTAVNAARGDDSWGPTNRFYCSTEQSIYAKVRWVTLGGCLYFLPELFATRVFQTVLESLFPDRMPLTHLLRFAMLPVDPIWAKVRRVEEIYLKHADRLVGVHVRYRGGYEAYQVLHDIVNSNFKDCVTKNGILPNTSTNSSDGILSTTSTPPRTVLFISSLYKSLHDDLSNTYPQMPTATGEVVGLVQLSSEGDQYSGLEIDSRALVEILCLSLSDVLLTSPMSTYSELAHAYGGLRPWIINIHGLPSNEAPACLRGKSVDACYEGATASYQCPHDPPRVDQSRTMNLVPCEDDGSAGLQLVY